ncbi:MAG: glycosyl hydrolase, partial [Rubrobacter sp.]
MDERFSVRGFASPPAAHGPAPLLVFNDEHEGEAGEGRISRLLEGHGRVGYGGVFLHPRPGLVTEYLSPRWFKLIRHAVRECKRLGLVPYLYDENSYPSGFAGGHVPARVPEART